MKKLILFLGMMPVLAFGQSIHQQQQEHYNALGIAADDYYQINQPAARAKADRGTCTPNKVVFGWHPYWGNGLEVNYDWDLLTDFSYFSYEVNASTGNANSTHGWATNAAVTEALAQGKRVNLCVTLFSSHSTFFGNPTAVQTLITNLINLVQSRGAHGVNIDFEGIPLSQKTNFTNFMIDLCNQMHAAIPGSQVSTVLYAVDWNDVIDVAALDAYVDLFVVMGYAYYYNGSSTAGPCDPLFHFGSSYNYTLSKTISTYLDQGVTPSKLIMGLPYYGYEWATSSLTVPSSTTASGVAVTYKQVQNNSSGDYDLANRGWDADSRTRYYAFMDGGAPKQAFIVSKQDFGDRLKVINRFGIGGMGIWALSYDDGYSDLWDELFDKFTDCGSYTACSDTIYDMGGPNKNYYNDEDYTFTIAPDNATSIDFTFTQFDVEANYDYLYIYDGADINAPQIAGSPFTGTNSPGSFTSSTGAVTFRFTSDGATVSPGWNAVYECTIDNVPPTTAISGVGPWETQDFSASFTDTDNAGGSGVAGRYYSVIHFNGTEWRADETSGFFSDNFDAAIHPDWTSASGTWAINAGYLDQTDEASGNTNLYAALNQNHSDSYLYHWAGALDGAGASRRAGLHFMVDDPTLTNRGNNYFVWFRLDSDKIQIYETTADVFSLVKESDFDFSAGTWYDFKTTYNRTTGEVAVYVDNNIQLTWTDASPITAGDYISLRSGNAIWKVDNLKVFRSRGAAETITVGATGQLAYQNPDPLTPAGKIKSFAIDNARNVSVEAEQNVNVDWTAPADVTTVNDGAGADISTFTSNTQVAGNYSATSDVHSGVDHYEYAIGTTAGATDVVTWTANGLNLAFTHTGLSLSYGTTYYISVRAVNGAGLVSNPVSSNGALLDIPNSPPVAAFAAQSLTICQGDSVSFLNSSTDAATYSWTFQNGAPATSTDANPAVLFPGSGTYQVQLTATGPGGTDVISQNISIIVNQPPVASFTQTDTVAGLPNAIIGFTNTSTSGSGYVWDFGDGSGSTDNNPFHQFVNTGMYDVLLIASTPGCPNDTASQTIHVGVQGITEPGTMNLRLYPNPASDGVTVDADGTITSVAVYDGAGRLVQVLNTPGTTVYLPLDGLSSGAYVVHVQLETGEMVRERLVVE
jgi:spore germination protein YaaH/PKD repeat protein